MTTAVVNEGDDKKAINCSRRTLMWIITNTLFPEGYKNKTYHYYYYYYYFLDFLDS